MTETAESPLQQTPLTSWHRAHGAKMAPFAGWDMPIQYSGILAEHQQTRTQAAVFDICHMGEFLVFGSQAQAALAGAVTHNLETLKNGRCRYGFILNERGGIVDDCIIYALDQDRYMIVVNGACVEKDRAALRARLPQHISLEDISACTAKIDLQGPQAYAVLSTALDMNLKHIGYFTFSTVSWKGFDLTISRTGYTGELGYELYLPWDDAPLLWETLLQDTRVKPAGLGARDTLRLESGLPLYGQDLDEDHTPTEAGYGAMLTNTTPYAGKEQALRRHEVLTALTIAGRRSARHLDAVHLPTGEQVGIITSGSFAPTLGHCVALAWIKAEHADQPEYVVRAQKTQLPATRTQLPFYTGTAREKLA